MITSLLHINIEYENGLYAVNDKEVSELEAIYDAIEITAPFFNEENTLEEIEDAILMEEVDDIIITWSSGALSLVLALGRNLADLYGKNVYVPMELLNESKVISAGEGKVIFVKDISLIGTALENASHENEIVIPEVYIEWEKKVKGSRYYLTMKNGYDAFASGVYPQHVANTFAKHVLLDNEKTNVSAYMDLNSAIFSEKEICANNIDHIHRHQITKESVNFDGSQCVLKREVISYGEYAKKRKQGHLSHDHEYILKLEVPEDYQAFEDDLRVFEEKGITDTYDRRFLDECRWSNECSLKRMLRFVEKDGEIRPCITSEEALGKIGDDPDDVIIAASKRCDIAMVDRKCTSCPDQARCSGCAMLPANLSVNEYCDFIHRHKYIKEFIHRQHVAAFLAGFGKIFHDAETVRFSIPGNRFFYPGDAGETQEIFLCEKDGDYYCFNTQTAALVRIEEKFVFLLEAWAAGADIERQILNISLIFGFNASMAQETVIMGNMMLKNGRMIL